MLIFASSLCDS